MTTQEAEVKKSNDGDTINRQAAIDAIEFGITYAKAINKETGEVKELFQASNDELRKAADRIKQLPSAYPEQRWIPVDLQNNSPKENKVVLLGVRFRDDFKYFVTSRQDYNYWTGLGREIKGELRWQPLPEPYRKESK